MAILEIVIVLVIASTFFILSYFTKRMNPKDPQEEQPKSLRIFSISIGVLFLFLIWVLAPGEGEFFWKVLMSLLAGNSIYKGLKGWLIKPAHR